MAAVSSQTPGVDIVCKRAVLSGAITAKLAKLISLPAPMAHTDTNGICVYMKVSARSNAAALPTVFLAIPSVSTITCNAWPLYPDPNKPALISASRTVESPA